MPKAIPLLRAFSYSSSRLEGLSLLWGVGGKAPEPGGRGGPDLLTLSLPWVTRLLLIHQMRPVPRSNCPGTHVSWSVQDGHCSTQCLQALSCLPQVPGFFNQSYMEKEQFFRREASPGSRHEESQLTYRVRRRLATPRRPQRA